MRHIIFIPILVVICLNSTAQRADCGNAYQIGFENVNCLDHLIIDTVSNSQNIWAIGRPQKTVFTEAQFGLNAIVTDTLNSYPVNDTSSFYLVSTFGGGFFDYNGQVVLYVNYQVNTDSLNDYGMLELSPDNGDTWIDLINDTTYSSSIDWLTSKPTLTGNSNGWNNFGFNINRLGFALNITTDDTVLLKITFISDSIYDGLDGLMFDEFNYWDFPNAIEELQLVHSKAFPNPASQYVQIEFNNPNSSIFHFSIANSVGQLIYSDELSQQTLQLATDKLSDGIYYYYLTSVETRERAWGKFVVLKE